MADSDIFHVIGSYEMVKRHEALDYARAAAQKLECGLIVHYRSGKVTKIEISADVPYNEVREYPHGELM